MSQNGQPAPQAVPAFPWEVNLRNSMSFFEPTDDGGMTLCFCPVAQGAAGQVQLLPPMVRVAFGRDGWANFAEKVAASRSPIEIAKHLPPEAA